MGIPLTAIAGAFDQLAKQTQKFDQLEEQRKLLALELQRTAPEGYSVIGGPDGRPSLKYVGMSDPRIQTKLQMEAAGRQASIDSQVALDKALNPSRMAAATQEAELRARLDRENKVYFAGLEAASAFSAAATQLNNPDFLALDPASQRVVQAGVAAKFADANMLAPERAKAIIDQLSPEARAFLQPGATGQSSPGSVGSEQAAPQGLMLPPSGLEVGPQSSAPAKPAAAQPGAAQGPSPAAQPAQPPALEIIGKSIATKLAAGRPEADVRAEAVAALQGAQSPLAAFQGVEGVAAPMSLPQIQAFVENAIQDVREAPQRALDDRKAGIMAKQLPKEEAAMEAPSFQQALASQNPTGEDRTGPFYTREIEDPTPEQVKAQQKYETVVNVNSFAEVTRGNAEPIRKLREQLEAQGLPQDTASNMIADWANIARDELRTKFSPRRTGKAGETLILTPQKGGALVVDPNGTFRLTEGRDESGRTAGKVAKGAKGSIRSDPRIGRTERDTQGIRPAVTDAMSPEGLTPQGIAELIWANAHSEGADDETKQIPRFVWINASTRGLDQAKQQVLRENNEGVWRAMGKRPAQTSGVWLDMSTILR